MLRYRNSFEYEASTWPLRALTVKACTKVTASQRRTSGHSQAIVQKVHCSGPVKRYRHSLQLILQPSEVATRVWPQACLYTDSACALYNKVRRLINFKQSLRTICMGPVLPMSAQVSAEISLCYTTLGKSCGRSSRCKVPQLAALIMLIGYAGDDLV